jgi:Abnormal spindle-like microcephaly-assoc'd, ASPM-SPD-2-Hydin
VKRLSPPRTCPLIGLFLLSVFLLTESAAGQLTVNPVSVSFGSVPVGNSASQSVVVTNRSRWNLSITQETVSGAGFSVAGLATPLSISPGQKLTLTLSFAPQSAVAVSGSLSLTYSAYRYGHHDRDSLNSTATLALTGTGTSAALGQLAASPGSLNFANVQVGSSQAQSVILSNAGTSSLTISQATLSGSSFNLSGRAFPLTLGVGQSATLSVGFAPQSAGSVSGNIAFASNAANSTMNFPLSGTAVTAGQLTANPSGLACGSVQVGSSATLTDSLTNTGGTSVTLSQASSTAAAFGIGGLNLPLTLTPGASVTFSILFTPQSAANASGSITVGSNASDPTVSVALSGTGTAQGQLTLAPTTLSFGNVTVGSSASQASSLSASGASVTISSASLSGSEFSLSGISFPLTIAAGQSVPFTINFAPQAAGAVTATLAFASSAASAPNESLSGDGTSPPQHSVSLSWTDSGSGISGYNVYRGSVSGGPYSKINPAVDGPANYTDSSVLAGQTYYYVTTALNESGYESSYSNEVQAIIPSP